VSDERSAVPSNAKLSTERWGKPVGAVDDESKGSVKDGAPADEPVDIARSALDGAQRMAAGQRGPSRQSRRRVRQENLTGRRRGGYTGAGPDLNDPQPLRTVMAGYVQDSGWERPLAEASVFAEWARLVGADVAAHCEPTTLRDGELRVSAESTAWATQLRMLLPTITARLVAELGAGVVSRLVITGPVAPSWKHGGYSVRGARGPRDTYG